MKTSATELFGIKYPILNAGMGRVAYPNMVAAVSNAGPRLALLAGKRMANSVIAWARTRGFGGLRQRMRGVFVVVF